MRRLLLITILLLSGCSYKLASMDSSPPQVDKNIITTSPLQTPISPATHRLPTEKKGAMSVVPSPSFDFSATNIPYRVETSVSVTPTLPATATSEIILPVYNSFSISPTSEIVQSTSSPIQNLSVSTPTIILSNIRATSFVVSWVSQNPSSGKIVLGDKTTLAVCRRECDFLGPNCPTGRKRPLITAKQA